MQIFPLKTKEENNNIVFCIKVTHNLYFMLTQHYGVHKPRKKNVTETEKPNWQEKKKNERCLCELRTESLEVYVFSDQAAYGRTREENSFPS